jgi:hypothetical protein
MTTLVANGAVLPTATTLRMPPPSWSLASSGFQTRSPLKNCQAAQSMEPHQIRPIKHA